MQAPSHLRSKENMAIISNTAPYSTPAANLNLDAMNIVKVQPASIFNTAMSVSGISKIFSGSNSIALAPSKVVSVPAITPQTVGAVYTSKAPTSLITSPTKQPASDFGKTFTDIATNILNLGANVLMNKYAPKAQAATVADKESGTPEGKTAAPQTQVFQNGQPLDTGFNALLGNLAGAFFTQQKQQTEGGVVTSTQPTMLSYIIGGAVILLIIVLLIRRK